MQKVSVTDLRTVRTKNTIFDTFQQMLNEMSYDKITIKELSARAGINRKTFYSHYDSIDDLRDSIVNELMENIKVRSSQNEPHTLQDTLTSIYDYLCELPAWAKNLLTSDNCDFSQIITEQLFDERAENVKYPKTKQDLQSLLRLKYITVSFLDLFKTWNNNPNLLTKDEFMEIAMKLILNGAAKGASK